MTIASVNIRSVCIGDAAAIAEIYRPIVENTAISFEFEAPDEAEMRSRIERIARDYPWLVALSHGDVPVGYAYASRHRERAAYASSVDVSVYVAQAARGQGVGDALYSALFDLLERRGVHRAFAGIALPNPASVALHRKHRFTLVGVYHEVGKKFGRWIDVAWWERGVNPDA